MKTPGAAPPQPPSLCPDLGHNATQIRLPEGIVGAWKSELLAQMRSDCNIRVKARRLAGSGSIANRSFSGGLIIVHVSTCSRYPLPLLSSFDERTETSADKLSAVLAACQRVHKTKRRRSQSMAIRPSIMARFGILSEEGPLGRKK